MDDSVQIRCKCKNVFRERARRLQNGYARQCPSCEVLIFFDEDSQNPNIKKAMRRARQVRKDLREVDAGKAAMPGHSTPAVGTRLPPGRSKAETRPPDSARGR